MDRSLLDQIGSWIGSSVLEYSGVGGGDISRAYHLRTNSDMLFCKVHNERQAFEMFTAEKIGLDAIRSTGLILAPEVHFCEKWEEGAVLIMEYIDSKRPTEKEMATFGSQLAQLHLHSNPSFGWESDNFIGSLPQSNKQKKEWSVFYIEERLLPQFEYALNQGLLAANEIPAREKMLDVLDVLFSGIRPSLLHGDLWSGNYLIRADGNPYLIDPAVYYGHGEVDIAMSQLFGGFAASFYQAYEKTIPSDKFSDDRIKIYQLYYLLVHLNLFGRSYYSGVMNIIKQYF